MSSDININGKHKYLLVTISTLIILLVAAFTILLIVPESKYSNTNQSSNTSDVMKSKDTDKQSLETAKRQECPDQWYENRMPSDNSSAINTQYFIINGERMEITDFDMEWIASNCSVEIEYVY